MLLRLTDTAGIRRSSDTVEQMGVARSRQAALYCVQRLGWRQVRCDDGSTPFPVEDIHAQLLGQVQALL